MLRRLSGNKIIIWNGENPERLYETDRPEILIPKELLEIAKEWHDLSSKEGDKGSCVIGARMEFFYNGYHYKMYPQSRWQGEGSWIPFKDLIKEKLEKIGCTDVKYEWGILD